MPLDASGMLCDTISFRSRRRIFGFVAAGWPNRHFDGAGKRRLLKFRWVCVTSESTIGAMWRCYAQHGQHYKVSQWQAMEPLYFFDAQSGALEILNSEDAVIEIEAGWNIRFA